MKESTKRTVFLCLILGTAWGCWYGFEAWRIDKSLNALSDFAQSADLNTLLTNPPEEIKNAVDLAVRGIKLSQGGQGKKNFSLEASWATLNQKTGDLTVRNPDILYYMQDQESGTTKLLHTTSNIGRVENGNQVISMLGDIKSTYEQNVLTGNTAVFRNEERTLTYTEGAKLLSPELQGTANLLSWDLDTSILTGSNGVQMRWTPSSPPFKGSDEEFNAKIAELEGNGTSSGLPVTNNNISNKNKELSQ